MMYRELVPAGTVPVASRPARLTGRGRGARSRGLPQLQPAGRILLKSSSPEPRPEGSCARGGRHCKRPPARHRPIPPRAPAPGPGSSGRSPPTHLAAGDSTGRERLQRHFRRAQRPPPRRAGRKLWAKPSAQEGEVAAWLIASVARRHKPCRGEDRSSPRVSRSSPGVSCLP